MIMSQLFLHKAIERVRQVETPPEEEKVEEGEDDSKDESSILETREIATSTNLDDKQMK